MTTQPDPIEKALKAILGVTNAELRRTDAPYVTEARATLASMVATVRKEDWDKSDEIAKENARIWWAKLEQERQKANDRIDALWRDLYGDGFEADNPAMIKLLAKDIRRAEIVAEIVKEVRLRYRMGYAKKRERELLAQLDALDSKEG